MCAVCVISQVDADAQTRTTPQDGQGTGVDVAPPALTLHGFATLGYAQSSASGAEYIRDLSQPNGVGGGGGGLIDSNLGVQLNYRSTDALEWVAQVVSHQRYDSSYTPELTWAFAKLEVTPRTALRIGRIGTEFLMQSDSRMIGYSHLAVRPPVEFYGGVPINYGDGADLQYRVPIADGILKASVYAGTAREDLPANDLNGSPLSAVSLGYALGTLQLRLIHAEATLANPSAGLQPLQAQLAAYGAASASSNLTVQGNHTRYDSAGIDYDDGNWQFAFALNQISNSTVVIEDSTAGFLRVAKRYGAFSPFVSYAWALSQAKALDTGLSGAAAAALNPAVVQALRASHQDQQTTSVGVRWDFARNVDCKVQLDFVHGDPSSVLLYQHVQSSWTGKTTVLSLALDYVF